MRVRVAWIGLLAVTGTAGAGEIAPGVAVDQGPSVFLMSPARRVEARDILTGALRWSSAEAVRPLAAGAGRVLAQADAPSGRLDLVILAAASGGRLASLSAPLPDGVSAPIDEVLGTRFDIRVERTAALVRLDWTWEHRPVRGALLEDDDEQVRRAAGAVVVNLLAATVVTVAPRPPQTGPLVLPPAIAAEADAGAFRQRPVLIGSLLVGVQQASDGRLLLKRWTEAGAPLPDAPLPDDVTLQMGSQDGRHVLVSRPAPGAPIDRAHEWTVIAVESGLPAAAFATAAAAAPFAVVGGRVLVVLPPVGHATAAGWEDEPRRLEAFDLASAARAWMQPIRDTAYQGPFAP